MAAVDGLDEDRDTSLPSSALSPSEYRAFRSMLVNDVHTRSPTDSPSQVELAVVLDFLESFQGVTRADARKVPTERV
jgi:hypothetical protein